eukprot:376940-Amorphochlora_amoeboformis.AAC.1
MAAAQAVCVTVHVHMQASAQAELESLLGGFMYGWRLLTQPTRNAPPGRMSRNDVTDIWKLTQRDLTKCPCNITSYHSYVCTGVAMGGVDAMSNGGSKDKARLDENKQDIDNMVRDNHTMGVCRCSELAGV